MLKKLIKEGIVFLIKVYQKGISPWAPASCRYAPSCSVYSTEAIKKYVVRKGLRLTLKRISSCHPWGGHGYDPVP